MKICHLITRMILGGAQENTLLTLQGLKRDTPWELHLAYGPELGDEGSLLEETQRLGVALDPLKYLCRNLSLWHDLLAYEELIDYFRRERFDLVHTHSSKAGILGRIAARRAGVPHIVHSIHGLAFDEFQPFWKNGIYQCAERIAAENCDEIIAVCQTMADRAIAAGGGTASHMHVIYSGFPLDPFLAISPRSSNARFVIGMIARMFELKGHEDLMQLAPMLFKEWNDVDLLIVGDGPLRQRWLQWLTHYPQWESRIQFAGRISPKEIPHYLSQMDVLVHLSWREGLARTIPQAMAAGRPPITYDVGGAAEIVTTEETGWIVSPGDLNSVMDAIRLLKTDRLAALKLGQYARQRVRSLFAVEVMQRKILDLYRKMGLT